MKYAIPNTLYAIFSILHAVCCTLNAIFFHAIRFTLHAVRYSRYEPQAMNYCQLATGNWQLYSTTVEDSLQIRLFIQNEPKFRKVKLNVNKVLTKDYEQMDTWWSGKNEPKTNPNKAKQTQFQPKKCQNKANSNPTCRGVASGEAGTNPI
jgi:hypothetical protein